MSVIERVWALISLPHPARPLGAVRIGIGIAALIRAVEALQILPPLTDDAVLKLPYASWLPDPDTWLVTTLMVVWFLSAVTFTLGWRTRVSGATLTTTIALVIALDQQAYSNHLYLMLLLVGLLTAGDAGAAYSLDAKTQSRSSVSYGPVFLMKLQISIVYGFAALTKLNESFLSGEVLASHLDGGLVPFPDGLRTPVLLTIGAAAAVIIELFLAFGLWSARLRHSAIATGLVFHVAITLLMQPTVQLLVFTIEMLAVYLLFVGSVPHSRTLVWDDSCQFCGLAVSWIGRLDMFDVHRIVGSSDRSAREKAGVTLEDSDRAVQLVGEEDRSEGYDAVGRALEVTPAAYLIAPFHRLPGVRQVGRRLYRWIATRRDCRAGRVTQI